MQKRKFISAPPRPVFKTSTKLPWVQLRNTMHHPNIYRRMIGPIDPAAENGDLVSVYDRDGELFGTGLLSINAPLGLRMLTFDASEVNESIIAARLANAARLRTEMLGLDKSTDAYRVVHAEGDGLPGLMVDRFAEYAVVELFGFPMHRRLEAIREELKMLLGVEQVLVRADARSQELEGFTLPEDAPAGPLEKRSADRRSTVVTENGLRFQIDLTHGHKTGFFCDQRDNRDRLAEFTADQNVLDLCCYTGGFGVYAAAAGRAKSVTCVDLDEDAIALAQRNANLNKIPKSQLTTVHSDVFPFLRQLQAGGKKFDVVVLDPPKLIGMRELEEEGRTKYYDLNRLALTVTQAGGLLLTSSCSGLLSLEAFTGIVRNAARAARRRVQFIATTGAGPDHPVMADCPESEYLKCLWCRVW